MLTFKKINYMHGNIYVNIFIYAYVYIIPMGIYMCISSCNFFRELEICLIKVY